MKDKIENKNSMKIKFSSSVDHLVEINSSFDKGVLKIAYWGGNRNRTYISKQRFEDAIPTMFNCPIVCNYNRETDSIGEHDIDIVHDDNGNMKIVNITQPVGVVPESANYWWETVEEDDGKTHEYLCTEVLVWKRQEAYEKIKENKITDESMEIKIISGRSEKDGYYHIDKFEFQAFCLLESAAPCFESASVELFSYNEFTEQYELMMEDFKNNFKSISSSNEVNINSLDSDEILTKGGMSTMDKIELLKKYNLTAEELDFSIDEMSCEELEVKLKEKFAEGDKGADGKDTTDTIDEPENNVDNPDEDGDNTENGEEGTENDGENDNADEPDEPENDDDNNDGEDEDGETEQFNLTISQTKEAIYEALRAVKFVDPDWGECQRYWYVDADIETLEVYCHDEMDWKLYGFKFSFNGDNVVIDFESKKRKKFAIVDFEEGEQESNFSLSDAVAEIKSKYREKSNELEKIQKEIGELREFKKAKDADEKEEVLSQFKELEGIDAFEELKSNYSDMSINEIEDRCYSIIGRLKKSKNNYSLQDKKSVRISVESNQYKDEPYNGLFIQYK